MEANAQQSPSQSNQTIRQILALLLIYFLITLSSKTSHSSQLADNFIIELIKRTQNGHPNVADQALTYFTQQESYVGVWSSQKSPSLLSQKEGKMYLKNLYSYSDKNVMFYTFQIYLYNGDYIDEGVLTKQFIFNSTIFQTEKKDNSLVIKLRQVQVPQDTTSNSTTSNSTTNQTEPVYQTVSPHCIQMYTKIFNTLSTDRANCTQLQFRFQIVQGKEGPQLQSYVFFQNVYQINNQQELRSANLTINSHETRLMKNLIYGVLLFVISYLQFLGVMEVIINNYQGLTNASIYSAITVTMAMMTDTLMSAVCFLQSVSNHDNLVLYIIPFFMFCLLFFNRDLQLLLQIFQTSSETSVRSMICRFNLIVYGSYVLVYPLLLFTNLGWPIFVMGSLIFLPQIIKNGVIGVRPDIFNAYYSKFIMPRLLMIFYLRLFPYNIYDLKPDPVMVLVCTILILVQIYWLYLQKTKGPRIFIPRFLLAPVFQYFVEEINLEEGADSHQQCTICLTSLMTEPDTARESSDGVKGKLMRTPCNHVYHSNCLTQWMKIKKVCPQCRSPLPAYE